MNKIFDVKDIGMASSGSFVRISSLPNHHPFYATYDDLVVAVDALAMRSPLHLSGESGSGKSHFLSELLLGPPDAFYEVCRSLGLPRWKGIKCHRIFVSMLETPSEVWYVKEIVNLSTEEREQPILKILEEASKDRDTLHVIWLVESGRGITESVQGAFLEIVGQRTIREPGGKSFDANNVTFCTDSNHAANESGEFAIWDMDQAYGRRWLRRMSFAAFSTDQEAAILSELAPESKEHTISQVATLAGEIRRKHSENTLQSILPPTIDAELDLLGCLRRLPVDPASLVFSTLLGHCSARDLEDAKTVFAGAFGVKLKSDSPATEAVGTI